MLVSIIIVFTSVTYFALESDGIVIVETQQIDSRERRLTHVWFVTDDVRLYLEAGNPNNPWVKDLSGVMTIQLQGEGLDGVYGFTLHKGKDGHQKIRAMMRAKYGWRDWWIGLLFNVSESWLVELSPK